MLFNEIYGNYYNAVAEILRRAVRGDLTRQEIYEIVERKAFGESVLSIPGALSSGEWPFLTADMETPLLHEPQMPLTTLQKRWMKALLEDPRIRLFCDAADAAEDGAGSSASSGLVSGASSGLASGLEDVEPLYRQDAIVYFDQYSDGDPYEDEQYAEHFRTVMRGLREHRKLRIRFTSSKGKSHVWTCVPLRMDYSLKDDKFRLMIGGRQRDIINIARIAECELLEAFEPGRDDFAAAPKKKQIVMELVDKRNALERAMLHFSHLEKETEKLDDRTYRITLRYNTDDETEMLIRVISFGPMLKVLGPEKFIERIRERLEMQKQFD